MARLRALAVAVTLGLATAAAVSYAPVPRLVLIMLPVGLAVTLVVFASPVLAAVLVGASIPELQDVTGGHLGLHVAASDVVLVLVAARVLAGGCRITTRCPCSVPCGPCVSRLSNTDG